MVQVQEMRSHPKTLIIFTGFEYAGTIGSDFGDFPGGITTGLQSYAANNQECIEASMTEFLQHVSYIILGKNFRRSFLSFNSKCFSSSNVCYNDGENAFKNFKSI